jgi:hypothetical protein
MSSTPSAISAISAIRPPPRIRIPSPDSTELSLSAETPRSTYSCEVPEGEDEVIGWYTDRPRSTTSIAELQHACWIYDMHKRFARHEKTALVQIDLEVAFHRQAKLARQEARYSKMWSKLLASVQYNEEYFAMVVCAALEQAVTRVLL